MDAKSSPPSGRRGRPWEVRPWTLVAFGLLMTATLIQACSDNDGTSGPRFAGGPAATTGFANTSADIRVVVGVNPNTITPGRRAGVTAFVTNLNGQPLPGKMVQFSTDVGTLDQTVVFTNASGQASTTLSVSPTDAANAQGTTSATVTAFVEAAVPGIGLVNFGPPLASPSTTPAAPTTPAVSTTSAAPTVPTVPTAPAVP
jgi:hypothetical protein